MASFPESFASPRMENSSLAVSITRAKTGKISVLAGQKLGDAASGCAESGIDSLKLRGSVVPA
jgi:hypothetical protein